MNLMSAASECESIAEEIGLTSMKARPSLLVAEEFQHDVELKALQEKLRQFASAMRDGNDSDGRPVSPSEVAGGLGDIILETLGNERWGPPMILALGNEEWRHLQQVLSKINDVRKSLRS